MSTIESIIWEINRELAVQFEERLRQHLVQQDKEWLIEQVIRLSLQAQGLDVLDRRPQKVDEHPRAERLARVRNMALDESKLMAFLTEYEFHDEDRLIREGYLINNPPPKGAGLIPLSCRSQKGEALLATAKDMLFALLFGDEDTNTQFRRVQRELLTIALPRFKASALGFMQASTELSAQGTWQDPERIANDLRADNFIVEFEF